MKDVKITEIELKLQNGKKGKMAIFVYAGDGDVIDSLNNAISLYVGNNSYHEFINETMDDPWTRIIIDDISNLQQYNFISFIRNKKLSKINEIKCKSN